MEQTRIRPVLEVETQIGRIRVEIHVDKAPMTASYVLDLVQHAAYDGSSFYRSTTLGRDRQPLVQGGPWSDFICGKADTGPALVMLEEFETTNDSGLCECNNPTAVHPQMDEHEHDCRKAGDLVRHRKPSGRRPIEPKREPGYGADGGQDPEHGVDHAE